MLYCRGARVITVRGAMCAAGEKEPQEMRKASCGPPRQSKDEGSARVSPYAIKYVLT